MALAHYKPRQLSCVRYGLADSYRLRSGLQNDGIIEHRFWRNYRYKYAYRPLFINPSGAAALISANQLNIENGEIPTAAASLHPVEFSIRPLFAIPINLYQKPCAFAPDKSIRTFTGSLSGFSSFPRLPENNPGCNDSNEYKHPFGGCIPLWRLWGGGLCWFATWGVLYYYRNAATFRWRAFSTAFGACGSGIIGCLLWAWWRCLHDGQEHSQREKFHGDGLSIAGLVLPLYNETCHPPQLRQQ
jgi:hypothetical protein